jgi:hypothetical protein
MYRKCPKHTKLLVAKAIVQAIHAQDPPGRFLEKVGNKWRETPYKKAVEKTSQALRERETDEERQMAKRQSIQKLTTYGLKTAESIKGAGSSDPEGLKQLSEVALKAAGLESSMTTKSSTSSKSRRRPSASPVSAAEVSASNKDQNTKKKANNAGGTTKKRKVGDFVKPAWWSRGTPMETPQGLPVSPLANNSKRPPPPPLAAGNTGSHKRMKTNNDREKFDFVTEEDSDEPLPLPMASLETRQSSMFRFLDMSGIFGSGRSDAAREMTMSQIPSPQQQQQEEEEEEEQQVCSSLGSMGRRTSAYIQQTGMFSFSRNTQPSPTAAATTVSPYPIDHFGNIGSFMGRSEIRQQDVGTDNSNSMNGIDLGAFEPLSIHEAIVQHQTQNGMKTMGLLPSEEQNDRQEVEAVVPPPSKGLTSQLSDWVTSFNTSASKQSNDDNNIDNDTDDTMPEVPPPPGGTESLSRGVSSSIFGLVESPSMFLTTLKAGVSSIFGNPFGTSSSAASPPGLPPSSDAAAVPPPPGNPYNILGEAPKQTKRDSLLDDVEETPMETKLRNAMST